MQDQAAELAWRDGSIPVARRFDDPYFSLAGGLAETRHVFLDGNDLPDRFCDGFQVAELGFGTGLNLLCAEQAFASAVPRGRLRFTSFEAFPMAVEDMSRALSAFPELNAGPLLRAISSGECRIETDRLSFELILGDARTCLPAWSETADAWFLDGFSPAKNPEMWEDALMTQVARHTRAGGTFATYTAAGSVRRALQAAGFEVARRAGFGRKRHMSTGVLR
ncbi:MAG: tRNA (5-methylaminomethyl-2-thiouridine)(34)-methyltransferase MnmD [Pseudomonadota bacterium]